MNNHYIYIVTFVEEKNFLKKGKILHKTKLNNLKPEDSDPTLLQDRIRNQIRTQMRNQIRNQTRNQIRNQNWNQIRN